MRKLAEGGLVKRALETLKGRARIKRTMWSRRAQEYEAKINSGDIVAIAEVVRDLYRSETQPEQSYSERQLYEAALDRLSREISAVQRCTETEAIKEIEGGARQGSASRSASRPKRRARTRSRTRRRRPLASRSAKYRRPGRKTGPLPWRSVLGFPREAPSASAADLHFAPEGAPAVETLDHLAARTGVRGVHGDRADRGADDRRRDAKARALAELRERMRLARRGEGADREGQGGESDGGELGELVHGRDPLCLGLGPVCRRPRHVVA